MKTRYIIQLAYDGQAYHGWQIQPNGISVQEVLQQAFSTLLREDIKVVGCGRTDTGVHAQYFVAHINVETAVADLDKLIYQLNGFLPNDVVVFDIMSTTEDFHARFTATARSYEYHLVTYKSPFLRHYSYRPNFQLDFETMNTAAKYLLGYTDFTSFSKLHSDAFTNNCDVMEAVWKQKDENHWVFHITADRFLRNMVRAIVGTLLEVGKGKMSIAEFCRIIEEKNRNKAGVSVPAQALFLTNVQYPTNYIKR